ncbi:hypothetical protein JCGZ_14031 [Jatropha curcas]|uniref:Secreted protein n=1 Tax=Jatropha curcas TaxID=180498 RepID=A0A067K7N2_JATCU|nr:hypothetical protein JCGZ_14031 [Jatropha curcas]
MNGQGRKNEFLLAFSVAAVAIRCAGSQNLATTVTVSHPSELSSNLPVGYAARARLSIGCEALGGSMGRTTLPSSSTRTKERSVR